MRSDNGGTPSATTGLNSKLSSCAALAGAALARVDSDEGYYDLY